MSKIRSDSKGTLLVEAKSKILVKNAYELLERRKVVGYVDAIFDLSNVPPQHHHWVLSMVQKRTAVYINIPDEKEAQQIKQELIELKKPVLKKLLDKFKRIKETPLPF